jgi:hypothetical protein
VWCAAAAAGRFHLEATGRLAEVSGIYDLDQQGQAADVHDNGLIVCIGFASPGREGWAQPRAIDVDSLLSKFS